MVDEELLRRYLQLGMAFTQMTRAKAEQALHDLARARTAEGPSAQAVLDDLLDWSRRNAEAAFDMLRGEASRQFEAMGVTSVDDLANLVVRLAGRAQGWSRPTPRGSSPDDARDKAAAKKTAARKAAAKKTAARKAAAKKTGGQKTPAKKRPSTKRATKSPSRARKAAG